MRLGQRGQLCRPRACLNSSAPAVITYPGVIDDGRTVIDDRSVVDNHIALIYVVHNIDVDVVDRAVVVEDTSVPVAALVAHAHIAVSIVDSAIEPNVPAPVAVEEHVVIVRIAPITRRPQRAAIGSLHPHAGHPIVARGSPRPVARGPLISIARSRRLIIGRQRRRRLRRLVFRLDAID